MATSNVKWYDRPYQEAVDYLLLKGVVTREEFDLLEGWARARAFTITGITKLDVLQAVLENLIEALQEGRTLKEFTDDLTDIYSAAGIEPATPWRAETIFRTNVQSAYGAGQFEQLTDPEIADEIWGWEYKTVGDDRVRPEHEALEGSLFEMGQGDEFFPPWDFNCRCTALTVTRSQAEEEGLVASEIPQISQDAMNTSTFAGPGTGQEDYNPDMTAFFPGLVAEYEKEQQTQSALEGA